MSTEKPTVAILLATKDGERFLSDQLKSFAGQAYAHWKLIVSDDGSSDSTLQIIEAFRPSVSNAISVRPGPRKGYSENFMSLARDPTIVSDYYAFCDQDDIWECDKLDRALAYLTTMPADKPALYFARTELIDESNSRTTGKSPLFTRPPSFANARVQNIGGGNTMVFNAAAKRLLELTSEPVVSHDWWTYQVVTAADGYVKYDAKTSVKYRQHDTNVMGSNMGWHARMMRLGMLIEGRFSEWNTVNLRALRQLSPVIKEDNLKIIDAFESARRGNVVQRLWKLREAGVYRQTVLGNVGLYAAALLRKL